MLLLPRLSISNGGLTGMAAPSALANRPRNGSPVGGSILTTSAPQSARIAAHDGPATQTPISTTLMPSIGPAMASSLSEVPLEQIIGRNATGETLCRYALTEDMKTALNNALTDRLPCLVATASASGHARRVVPRQA